MPASFPDRHSPALAATALVLLLGACGGNDSDDSAPRPPAASPTAVDTTDEPSSRPASSPPPPPSPVLPEAADGTDLDSCADSRCEVQVKPGDTVTFDAGVNLRDFTVVDIGDNALSHKASGNGTRFGGSMTAPGTSTVNGVKVKIVAVEGDRAVIRMS